MNHGLSISLISGKPVWELISADADSLTRYFATARFLLKPSASSINRVSFAVDLGRLRHTLIAFAWMEFLFDFAVVDADSYTSVP